MGNQKIIGSAGGQARAIQQHEESIKRYYENPNICLCCGNIIEIKSNQNVGTVRKKKFCNQGCAAKYNNSLRNKKSNTYVDKVSDNEFIEIIKSNHTITEICNKLGYNNRPSKEIHDKIFNRAQQLNIEVDIKKYDDINSKNKKDVFLNAEYWSQARSKIQRPALNKYNKSDKPKHCVVCGYDKHYEVAHIKAVSDFSDNSTIEEINNIDNLIALCPNHHWEYDHGLLDISEFL